MTNQPVVEYRRAEDRWHQYLPLIIAMLGWIFSVGVIYGKLGVSLESINYRLTVIEKHLHIGEFDDGVSH